MSSRLLITGDPVRVCASTFTYYPAPPSEGLEDPPFCHLFAPARRGDFTGRAPPFLFMTVKAICHLSLSLNLIPQVIDAQHSGIHQFCTWSE